MFELARWSLTTLAAMAVIAALLVGYYFVDPGDYGALPRRVACTALAFPVIILGSASLATLAAGIAAWSGAKLACAGFGLAAVVLLLLAVWPAVGLWSMARTENVAVSVAWHFALDRQSKDVPSRVTQNVVYGRAADGTDLVLDVWPATAPAHGGLRPAFVRVHGGSWIYGAKSQFPNWNTWLNELGYVVFDVEYRMPPPNHWKDEVGDVKCASGWVLDNADKYGIDPSRISMTGYSAGGNLAMLAAYSMKAPDLPPSCEARPVPVKTVVNVYGPTDLTRFYDTTGNPDYVREALATYVGGPVAQFPDRYKAISPLNYVGSKTPPTITILGLSDRMVPKEQAVRLDQALDAAGIAHETYFLPGTDHGFDANWGNLATQLARAKIKAFVEKNG
jgi:acetyl esterase/lipase